MSLSTKILLALLLGLGVGMFFGEMAAPLEVVGDAFIQLLQMTVLPYITFSLVASLGSMTYEEAKPLALKGGALLLLLWGIALALVFTFPLAFPSWESASFFSTTLVERGGDLDFLDLYIPANPFHSLANNVVPAVVLFSVVVGIALIGIEGKNSLIDSLKVLTAALSKVTGFVVRLTPIGIFAIGASAAGTMSFEELGRLQVFLITYIAVALLVTFWILPGLVTALTPLSYSEVVGLTKDALITAFMTGNLFIVLPILTEKSKEMLSRHDLSKGGRLVDVIVPASFNFPNIGKVLTLSFILFAAWFSDTAVELSQYPSLALSGLVSFFGNLNVAVPFLLDLLRIPADMFQLFLVSGLINARFGTLIAAMHTVSFALLGTYMISGSHTFQGRRVLRYIVLTVIFTGATIGGIRAYFGYALKNEYSKDQVIAGMQLLRDPVPAVVHSRLPSSPTPPADPPGSRLDGIQSRGYLRVGYIVDNLPYAYLNSSAELVGFDVEMAHMLARELHVTLEFLPVACEGVAESLNSNLCDIVMSGYTITTRRAQEMAFSTPYMEETLAFLVRDHRRAEFGSREAVQDLSAPKIGIVNLPYYVEKLRRYLPQAELVILGSWSEFFERESEEGFDAMLVTAERGSAASLLHPQYSVAVPFPDVISAPIAYAIPRGDHDLVHFVNSWIELKKRDRTIQSLYDHWILGKTAEKKGPRWSLIRDVFHWVE